MVHIHVHLCTCVCVCVCVFVCSRVCWFMCVVCSDELTRQNKGITVFTEEDRYRSLNHCRYVDEVLTDAPWCVTLDFLDEHQASIST